MNDIRLFINKEFFLLSLLFAFLIDPFSKGIYVFYIFLLVLLTKLSFLNYKLDGKGFLLLLFSIFYSLFYSINPIGGAQMLIIYALAPFTFYIIGRYFSMNYSSTEILYFLLVFIALVYAFIPAVSIIIHIIENGFSGGRNLSLLWDNGHELSATLIAARFTLIMSSLAILFIQKSYGFERKVKYVIACAFIISLLCILRLASRTQILIAFLTFILSALYLISRLPSNKKISLVFVIFSLAIVFISFYLAFSDSVIFNTFNERKEDTDYVMSGSGRTRLWLMSVGNVFSEPAGWSDSGITFAHNLWLDVSRVSGILPFLFLCIFTILSILLIFNVVKIAPENHFINITILSYFIGFMAVFFVEPIIEGLLSFFLIYCLFIGILSGYADNSNYRIKTIIK